MTPLGWIKIGAAVIVLMAIAGLYSVVSGWKEAHDRLPEVERERDAAILERDAQMDAARRSAEAAGAAEERLMAMVLKQTPVRVVYREAKRDDPDCAAWAAAPVLCPLDGMLTARRQDGASVP